MLTADSALLYVVLHRLYFVDVQLHAWKAVTREVYDRLAEVNDVNFSHRMLVEVLLSSRKDQHHQYQTEEPIPGTTKLHRLEENLGAAEVELTAEDLRELDDLTAQVEVSGARYGEGSQKLVNR